MAESSKKLKSSNVFSLYILCSNRNRSALVHELLSNNSLFVGRLYENKSHALRTRDMILLQLTSKHNNSLLELIYFLGKDCIKTY